MTMPSGCLSNVFFIWKKHAWVRYKSPYLLGLASDGSEAHDMLVIVQQTFIS